MSREDKGIAQLFSPLVSRRMANRNSGNGVFGAGVHDPDGLLGSDPPEMQLAQRTYSEDEEEVQMEDRNNRTVSYATMNPNAANMNERNQLLREAQERMRRDPSLFQRVSQMEEELLTSSDEDDGMGLCEKLYKMKDNSQAVLLSMAIGIKAGNAEGSRWLADFENDPIYKDLAQRSPFNPKVKELKEEMKRRSRVLKVTCRMQSALKPACYEWLKKNPIVDRRDVAFLRKEEATTYALLNAQAEEMRTAARERLQNANWNCAPPFLRLYCAMIHDEAREALLADAAAWTREELDARNHEERPETYPEVVARLYNDESVVFTTEALPELHESYAEPITLKFSEMPGGELSAEEAKTRIGDARARVISIILDWELSGNGFGQREEGHEDWGHFSSEHYSLSNGDNRANFVKVHKGQRFHHLYLWHLADTMGILSNVLNVLSKNVSADGNNTPATAVTRRRRKAAELKEEERQQKKHFREMVGTSLSALAISSKEENIRIEEDKIEKYVFAQLEARLDGSLAGRRKSRLYGQMIAHHKRKSAQLGKELRSMKEKYYALAGINIDSDGNQQDPEEEENVDDYNENQMQQLEQDEPATDDEEEDIDEDD
ncbi:unknown protein [Seminavis robusta]|uniref:Ig-like domain-containing protein n=1 Tax=Seminavis robusta TaxID=568900 RepID=A0A9N8EQ35_9STRA|nr:unknown protein [Seminavis robusta]|eukprot:Sro1531_g280170.1 n/a (605) ;mRNA; f:13230-15139